MDNLPAIEAWRDARRWAAAAQPSEHDLAKVVSDHRRRRLRNPPPAHSWKTARRKRRAATRLAGRRNLWTPATSARELARLFLASFSDRKWRSILVELEKLRAARNADERRAAP
jgi:hypothetical protein